MLRTNRLLQWASLSCGVLLLLTAVYACSNPGNNNNGDGTVDPAKFGLAATCPGAKGCLKSEGALQAGAAAVKITPEKYEIANPAYLKMSGFCPKPVDKVPFGLLRCGQFVEKYDKQRKDCGRDGICPTDKNVATRIRCDDKNPCAAGLECKPYNKNEKRCYYKYDKPDADGSEGDGLVDAWLDCGQDRICPCQDADKRPSYYGKGKKCLIGHTPNPDYKGPDADGSEGNGKFEQIWMGGFENNHPLQGVHDDTWSRAFVMRTGDTTVAIVSVDLVGFFFDSVQRVRKMVEEKIPGKIDYIMISSTHNHEGPDTMGLWGGSQGGIPVTSGINPQYFEMMLKRVADSIVEAESKLAPAKIKVASIDTGREGLVRDSRDPRIYENSLLMLQLLGASDNKPIASILNWGNHPEALSDTNNYLTSDYSHYIREALEKGIDGGTKIGKLPAFGGVGIYLQGAVGCLMTPLRVKVPDVNGKLQDKSNWDKAKALGYQLVAKAHEAFKKAEELKDPTLSFWVKAPKIPIKNKLFQLAFNYGIFSRKAIDYEPDLPIDNSNLPKVQTEIAIIRLGNMTFYSLPGEADPETLIGGYDGKFSYGEALIDPNNENKPDLSKAPKGPYLKARIPGKHKVFIGLGNDEIGYLVPSWNYQLHPTQPYFKQAKGDHYEETNSLGPDTLPMIMEQYKPLIDYATNGLPKK